MYQKTWNSISDFFHIINLSETAPHWLAQQHMVQNNAANFLTKSCKRTHVTLTWISLHWLSIRFRIQFKLLVVTFMTLIGQRLAYIKELLQPYITSGNPKSSDQGLFLCFWSCSSSTLTLSPIGLKMPSQRISSCSDMLLFTLLVTLRQGGLLLQFIRLPFASDLKRLTVSHCWRYDYYMTCIWHMCPFISYLMSD